MGYAYSRSECEEVANNLPHPTRPLTFEEALVIVRREIPDETETVLSNVAEALMQVRQMHTYPQ